MTTRNIEIKMIIRNSHTAFVHLDSENGSIDGSKYFQQLNF